MTNAPTSDRISDEAIADLMIRTVVINSVVQHKDGTPLCENFERARKMIQPAALAEEVTSKLRHVVTNFIAEKPIPDDLLRESDKDFVFTKKPPEDISVELSWMIENVDTTSFSSLTTLADLYKAAGFDEEADETYRAALKTVRESGAKVRE